MESTTVAGLRVGTGSVNLQADDSMVVAGSILPKQVKDQEGELRAVAIVIEKPSTPKLAIVVCDVIVVERDDVNAAVSEIERTTGISRPNILISATHTHHAPSTIAVHGYGRDEVFCQHLREGIIRAVQQADANLNDDESHLYFHQGEENTIGGNSRLLLADGTIWWVGPRADAVRPTGPFDPQLPVFAFRNPDGQLQALMYNHSTHTIGTCSGDVRSPSFYGLTAQELEAELGGSVCFLPGAFGSTHNVTEVPPPEAIKRLKGAITEAMEQAKPMPVDKLASIQRSFTFKVRTFDEDVEDEKVSSYCRKRVPDGADSTISVFRNMRQLLAPRQGQVRETTLQAMVIGEVAIVGVPGELFTGLGVDLKERSPFQHTYVVSLTNDWMGYLPDREAHALGGYQTWMGLHSYAEEGTGERMVDECLRMLQQLQTGLKLRRTRKDFSMVNYSFDREIELEQLQNLLRQTGWANRRSIEGIQKMLEGTPLTLGAWEGDRLVGFVRVITDGIYRALIDDVVVEESKRGTGIGSELMQRVVERLAEVEEVFLRCGEHVVPFYERHGFERSNGVIMDLKKD